MNQTVIARISVAAVWLIFIAIALQRGIKMGSAPTTHTGEPFPLTKFADFILFFMFLFAPVIVFLGRRQSPFRKGWVGSLIDLAFGSETWETWMAHIKPVSLIATTLFVGGLVGLVSTYLGSQSWTAYVNSGGALWMGAGIAIAILLSRKFPPTLE